MISLDPKKYMGKYRLVIRTWNGIDQPDYYPVLDITEEEMGFKAGRFVRCIGNVRSKNELHDMYIIVQEPKKDLGPIIEWIVENTTGNWSVDIVDTFSSPCWFFSFTSDEDAVLFKLAWNAYSSKYEAIQGTFLDNV